MSRNVIFVQPFPSEISMRFLRAAARLDDVRILGVVHTPPAETGLYHDVVRVTEPLSVQDTIDAVEILRTRHGAPHRIVGVLEAMMVHLAEVRERFGVAGTQVKTATLFRDKPKMKDALRAAGLPVARHAVAATLAEARAFVVEVGLPVVLKPPAGMGSKSTFRIRTDQQLAEAIEGMGVSEASPVLVEEMLVGREHTLETITVGGEPKAFSFSQYFPNPLEVLENPWIQWACILPREIDTPLYQKARELGIAAIRALGLENGMTHMEFYERSDGSIAIGEIAQRPPGPQLCHMTGVVSDIDVYRAWARANIDGVLDAPWVRKYAAGTAYIRGMGAGRVASITGVRETQAAIGEALVEAKLPSIGATKGDSYEGDGFVMVKDESTERVREMISTIIQTIKIRYV